MTAVVRRYSKGVAKRASILDAALDVLEREGETGASLRTIAKEADISLAGLIHYFPTRDVLFTELQHELDERAAQTYFSGFPSEDPGSLLAAAMRANMERPVLGMLHLMLSTAATRPDHPASAYFKQRYTRMHDVFAEHVRKLQATGAVGEDHDPDYIATAVIAAADGIRFQWLSDRSIDMPGHVLRTWDTLLGRASQTVSD
ncbi:DNA-binding transcriptional regulator, AcrR family [Nocardioides scoriae]|uniref:DNA-binding transcriptional regulator, AcrR family n=1 Tax=Nocardioides scoriae TaxID=642780 RepID=A0A1H1VIS4_9ACTN|nr:TetR/AcrR family transcriptional regulator [Nocardioides scoriae]SDS84643.1 DNA-binding transcriptional regulator, AcrR family [Nocardioides scoriae]